MTISKTFQVNEKLFPKNVLLRTCYTFIDHYFIYIENAPGNNWQVTLRLKKDSPDLEIDQVEGAFNNALINESFREALMDKTKLVKEVIVAKAMFGAENLIGGQVNAAAVVPEQDFSDIEKELDDYLDDPLGIAVPWEEQHGKGSE